MYNLSSIRSSIILEVCQNLEDILNDVTSSNSFKLLPFDVLKEMVHSPDLSTKQRFDTFMVWISENKVTKEEENEILASFDFEDFTVEELMTSVRGSGLYSCTKIDERVLELVKYKDNLLKDKDFQIQLQDSKIHKQRELLVDAKNFMSVAKLNKYRFLNGNKLNELGLY